MKRSAKGNIAAAMPDKGLIKTGIAGMGPRQKTRGKQQEAARP
jgi:hypothetical protein